jgi:hypothetical protein
MPKETGKALVARKKQKKELIFAGASHLLGVDPKKMSPLEVMAHKARALVSQALNVPINTVVIMGNQPYVDNHGRKWKAGEYAPGYQFEYEYVQIAKDDAEKAIVKCRIVTFKERGGKVFVEPIPLCGWVLGECSPATTRMGTLKGYQNHLAQTRAENRAFEAAFGTRFRKELYEGVARIIEEKVPTDKATGKEVVEKALAAGNTSAEEAVALDRKPAPADTYGKALAAIAKMEGEKKLTDARGKVASSKLYDAEQKGQLLRLIDAKLQAAA